MSENKSETANTSRLPGQSPTEKSAAKAVAKEVVEERLLLASYVDHLAPKTYTDAAKSTLMFEVKQYAEDVVAVTKMRRRADRNAENILRSHVLDSASFLRNKREDAGDMLADWCKWIGFLFAGLAINQGIHVQSEGKHIASGSVWWLIFNVVMAAFLLYVGANFNKPWEYFMERRNKKEK